MYYRCKECLEKGGCLSKSDDWLLISEIRYKPDSTGKIKLMSKDDLRGKGVESPDISDALAMTFAKQGAEINYGSSLSIMGAGKVGTASLDSYSRDIIGDPNNA